MDEIRQRLDKLKDEIYNISYKDDDPDSRNIAKLTLLDNITDDLKEIIILIHSNQKAELQAIRHYQVKTLLKMIDIDIDTLNKYKELLIEVNSLKKNNKRKRPFFTIYNIMKFLLVFFSVYSFVWILFKYDSEAAVNTFTFLERFFGVMKDAIPKQ